MARDKSLAVDKIDTILDELADFLNQKEAEKADIIAEEQLAQAFQKKDELN